MPSTPAASAGFEFVVRPQVDPTTKLPVDATAQCNDDSVDEGCGLGSSVVLSVTQGQEYFIVVDAKKVSYVLRTCQHLSREGNETDRLSLQDQTGTYTLFIDYAECDNVAYPCAIGTCVSIAIVLPFRLWRG